MTPGAGSAQASADSAAPTAPPRDSSSTYVQLFTAAGEIGEPIDDRPRARRPRRTRRRLVVLLVTLALLLAAVGVGWAWADHAAKQPALKALRTGTGVFEATATDVRAAAGIEELRDAARKADAAADRVDRAARPITPPSSDLERQVVAVLRSEAAVLRTTAATAEIDVADLSQWPTQNSSLAGAEEALHTHVRRLAALDADAGPPVRTGFALAAHTDEVVGDTAATAVTARLETLLDGLTGARTTRDVRASATRALRSRTAVAPTLEGLDAESPQGEQVTGVRDALAVLGRLERLDGSHLRLWTTVRGRLLAATEDLDDVDAGPAVETLDALVKKAGRDLRRWRQDTARATARAEKDSARLTSYVDATLSALQGLDASSRAAADFSGRVQLGAQGGVTYQTALVFLEQAEKDLAAVRTALEDAAPTRRLRGEHRDLVAALDRAIEAVQGGDAGIHRPAGCLTPAQKRAQKKAHAGKPGPAPTPACPYVGSPGWAGYRDGWSGATQDLSAARTAWATRAKELRAAIDERTLPRKPKV